MSAVYVSLRLLRFWDFSSLGSFARSRFICTTILLLVAAASITYFPRFSRHIFTFLLACSSRGDSAQALHCCSECTHSTSGSIRSVCFASQPQPRPSVHRRSVHFQRHIFPCIFMLDIKKSGKTSKHTHPASHRKVASALRRGECAAPAAFSGERPFRLDCGARYALLVVVVDTETATVVRPRPGRAVSVVVSRRISL